MVEHETIGTKLLVSCEELSDLLRCIFVGGIKSICVDPLVPSESENVLVRVFDHEWARQSNGSRLSWGRGARGRTEWSFLSCPHQGHKWNCTLLARARQLQALVRWHPPRRDAPA